MSNESEDKTPMPPEPPFKLRAPFEEPPPRPRVNIMEEALRSAFDNALKHAAEEGRKKRIAERRRRSKWFVIRSVVLILALWSLAWSIHFSPGRVIVFGLSCFLALGSVIGLWLDSPEK